MVEGYGGNIGLRYERERERCEGNVGVAATTLTCGNNGGENGVTLWRLIMAKNRANLIDFISEREI